MIDKIITFFLSLLTAFYSMGYTPTPVAKVNPENIPEFTKEQQITVLAYNVYFGGDGEMSPENRAPLIVETIRNFAPDSFGAEECTPEWKKLLTEQLPEYTWVGTPRNLLFGEASPVFYNSEKYEALNSGTFWLSTTPLIPSRGWDGQFNRVCSYVVLKDKITGFTYAHFNTHFDHRGKIARLEAVAVVSKMIAKICPGIPVILSGDLNETEKSEMYSRVVECGFADTRLEAKKVINGESATYHGYSDIQNTPIDFIFVNSTFVKSVELYETDLTKYNNIYPSDHHPVIAEMTIYN